MEAVQKNSCIPTEVSQKIDELAKDHFLGDVFRTILATAEHIQKNAMSEQDKTKYIRLLDELLSFEDHCLVYFFQKAQSILSMHNALLILIF